MSKKSISTQTNTTVIFGNRIKKLRTDRNLKQSELATQLSEFMNIAPITLTTISSWEQGRKLCGVETLKYLALFFNVSVDYLLGLEDEPREMNRMAVLDTVSEDAQIVKYSDLASVDGIPVLIETDSTVKQPFKAKWAIYDHANHQFVTQKTIYNANPHIIVRCSVPLSRATMENLRKKLITLSALKKMPSGEKFWVSKMQGTPEERAEYSGWYTNNESHSCIINDRGLTLPYDGLGVTYNAFTEELSPF